jgi:hypothetical protein
MRLCVAVLQQVNRDSLTPDNHFARKNESAAHGNRSDNLQQGAAAQRLLATVA